MTFTNKIIKVPRSEEPLERLIDSMSKSEKRYFRIASRLNARKDSTALKLFDDIINGKTGRAPQVPVTRHNLFKMIVRSLANFHNQRSNFGNLSDDLNGLIILYQRGLYDSCRKQVDKCIDKALAVECFSVALEFLTLKRKVTIATSPADETTLRQISKHEFETIQKITVTSAYWNSMINLREEEPALRAINTKQLPVEAQVLRLHGEFTRHYVGGDTSNASNAIRKLVTLIESDPKGAAKDSRSYLVVLSNQLELFIHLKNWSSVPALLKKINSIQSAFPALACSTYHIRLTLRIFNLELEYYRDTQQLDAAVGLWKKIGPFLDSDVIDIPNDYRLLFYFQFANIHFHRREYREALKLLNAINNGNYKKVRPDILIYSRLLNIIVHYELGNITLLDYLVGNAKRHLVRDKQLATFQGRIIKLVSGLTQATAHQKIRLLREAQQYLQGEGEEMATALDYLNLDSWVSEKLAESRRKK
jgi:hypothetical protein